MRMCHWLRRSVALLTALLLLVSCLPLCLSVAAAPALSVEISVGGATIGITEYNGAYGIYLPGYVDRSAVSIRYTGKTQLTVAGRSLKPGESAKVDLSADSVVLEEASADAGGSPKMYSVRVMGGSDTVPSMYITLDAKTSLSWLHIDKDNKGTGRMTMLSENGKEIYNGALDTIKGRGNTSFTQPGLAPDKKSYSIKLAEKAELVPGAGKMKKWALIHMRVCDTYKYDWTGLCNLLGYQTYAALAGDGYADVKARFVDLYIDGTYRGAYILAERVDVNAAVDIYDAEDFVSSSSEYNEVCFDFSDPAIMAGVQHFQYTADAKAKAGLDITGGYLLEINTPDLEEPCGFVTLNGMHVDIKAPATCTKEQVSYIATYFQQFENALYAESGYNEAGKHYSEYIDMDSLASLVLTYAFFKNWELFRTSTYMYLDTADSTHPKLTFGPAWDFETGSQTYYEDPTLYNKHQLYVDTESQCYNIIGQLTQKGDFQQVLFEKQKKLDKIIEATLGSGTYPGITHANTLWQQADASLEMNWARWNFKSILESKGTLYGNRENNYTYYATAFVGSLQTRQKNWKLLWDTNTYLLGLTVEQGDSTTKNCTLTARVNGIAQRYQWYRLGADNELNLIPGAVQPSYTATKSGTYYCFAYGNNNAYYGASLSDILNNQTVCHISRPVFVELGDFKGSSTTLRAPAFVDGTASITHHTTGTTTTAADAEQTTAETTSTTTATDGATTTTDSTTSAGLVTNTTQTMVGQTTQPTQGEETEPQPEQQPNEQPQETEPSVPPIYRVIQSALVCVLCLVLVWIWDESILTFILYRRMKAEA